MSPSATIEAIPTRATPARVSLVLGGARSGKSRIAEGLIAENGGRRIYLATAEAGDHEMMERIRRHRERRGDGWRTVEEPLDLTAALLANCRDDSAILVDCLTLWLSNLLGSGRDPETETRALVEVLPRLSSEVVFVSNEVGLGIVPDNDLARAFRDHAGRLNQAVAAAAMRVYFVAAGLPIVLKDNVLKSMIQSTSTPPPTPSRKGRGELRKDSAPPLRGRDRVGGDRTDIRRTARKQHTS